MSLLSTLFGNEKVKDMALGVLKKTMIENAVKFVVIDMQEGQNLDIQMFKAEQNPVIMSGESMQTIHRTMLMLNETGEIVQRDAEKLKTDNDRLSQICLEQNETISQYAEANARLRDALQAYGVGNLNNPLKSESDADSDNATGE